MSLLQKMGKYTLWADRKIWDIVRGLTDEEFNQKLCETSGCVADRYLHIADGHSYWYEKWVGHDYQPPDFKTMTRQQLFEHIEHYNSLIFSLAENVGKGPSTEQKSTRLSLDQEEMIFNIINHATYHRGQIVLSLRMLGKEIQPTDYVPYLMEMTGSQ
jgi:uncharacterized damage-inducible protein DinB